jgi:hypothetical protein
MLLRGQPLGAVCRPLHVPEGITSWPVGLDETWPGPGAVRLDNHGSPGTGHLAGGGKRNAAAGLVSGRRRWGRV